MLIIYEADVAKQYTLLTEGSLTFGILFPLNLQENSSTQSKRVKKTGG